jgi:SAM-dependent methyltransferase
VRAIGRAVNNVVVRVPVLWPLLRRPVTRFFDSIATGWDERIQPETPERRAPLTAALGGVDHPPARVLEIGTGTGAGAFMLADRFPEAEILGIDISPKMIELARAKLAERSAPRVRFEVADVAQLLEGETYDLVAMLNMPPFFDQVAKLLSPGGHVAHVSSLGARTPFYTPTVTLQKQFARRGIRAVKAGVVGEGTFYLGERPE